VLVPVVVVLASSSLYVYLTHWQVYPPIEEVSPALAMVASFAVGIAVWWLARAAGRAGGRLRGVILARVSTRVAARAARP
jgi:hypothetical protein